MPPDFPKIARFGAAFDGGHGTAILRVTKVCPRRGLVIEQDAIAGVRSIAFTVIHGRPSRRRTFATPYGLRGQMASFRAEALLALSRTFPAGGAW